LRAGNKKKCVAEDIELKGKNENYTKFQRKANRFQVKNAMNS